MELTPAISEHLGPRLTAALDQHEQKVDSVAVVVTDNNRPRGGIDQVCRISVRLFNDKVLGHQRRGEDLYANVSLLADTVNRRVGRHLAKRREHSRERFLRHRAAAV